MIIYDILYFFLLVRDLHSTLIVTLFSFFVLLFYITSMILIVPE